MKLTGIHCTVDKMGRIVLPAQVRHMLGFGREQHVRFAINDEGTAVVIVRVGISGCTFCGEDDQCINYRGTDVCSVCVSAMERMSVA